MRRIPLFNRIRFAAVLMFVALSSNPSVVEAAGDVWFVDATGPSLYRVTEQEPGAVAQRIADLPGAAFALAATGPDSVWVLLSDQPRLLRFDSTGGMIADVALGTIGSSVAVDVNGRVWVAFGALDEVRRYNAAGQVEASFTVGSVPYGLAIDAENSVWVTNAWGNSVTRIAEDGGMVEYPVGFYPTGIAAHPDGSVWVVEKEHVTVIDPLGQQRRLEAGSSPRGVTVAADGAVWVTNQSSSTVTRFGSTRDSAEFSVGLFPWGISSSGDGSVVVLCRVSGEIWRLSATGSLISVVNLPTGAYPHAFGDMSGLTSALVHKPEADHDQDGAANELEASLSYDLFDAASTPARFIRGDVDGDGQVELSDAWRLLDPMLECRASSDVNADGLRDLSDVSALLDYLFTDGPSPSPPFPVADYAADLLGC